MTNTTAQTTLLHTQRRDVARQEAIARIEALMLPGARALAGTRTHTSMCWLQRQHDLKGTAPFGDQAISLIWRDQNSSGTAWPHAPYDQDRDSYDVQILVPDSVGPELLAELARVAAILTTQIVRECEAITTAQCAALDAETEALRTIAV